MTSDILPTTRTHQLDWVVGAACLIAIAGMGAVLPTMIPHIFDLQPNAYALTSLLSVVLNATLLVILIRRHNHSEPMLWFAFYILCNILWGASEALGRLAVTAPAAIFWGQLTIGAAAFLPGSFYLFVRSYTAKKHLRDALIVPLVVLGTSTIMAVLAVATSFFQPLTTPARFPWGYIAPVTATVSVFALWATIMTVAAMVGLIMFYRRAKTTQDRRLAVILIVSVSLLLVLALSTQVIAPLLGHADVLPLGVVADAVMALGVIIGIYRNGNFSVSPAEIAGTVLGNMAGGVVVTDLKYHVLYSNQRAAELISPDGKDLTGQDLHLMGLNRQGDTHYEWEQMLKDRPVAEIHGFELGRGDKSMTLDLTVTKLQTQQPGYVFVMNDITELKHSNNRLSSQAFELATANQAFRNSEAAMLNLLEDARDLARELRREKAGVEHKVSERTAEVRAQRARLEASINSLDIGFYMVDANLRVIEMNQASHRVLQTNGHMEEVDRAGLQALLDADADLSNNIRTCLTSRQPYKNEAAQYGDKVLKVFVAPIIDHADASNPVLGAVVELQDITEVKALERSRDEFFSIASHELRTPLTAIRGNTSMIQQYFGDQLKDPSLREMIGDIHASSIRLITIVNDFLNTSRLEQGKIQFKLEPFDPADLIDEVVKEFKAGDSGAKVPIKASLKAVPNVLADRDRLKEALINLIGNAVKFTETGSITLGLALDGERVKLSVTDTGSGIPEDSQGKLFRKFQQASNNTLSRDSTKSTGLGLYISKMIITGMGGEIFLERSEAGKGSTFAIRVPAVKAAKTKPALAKVAS